MSKEPIYSKLKTWWQNSFLPRWRDFSKLMDEYGLGGFEFYSIGIIVGWVVGLLIGAMADWSGVSHPVVEGVVRLMAGSGDTIGGWISILIVRFSKSKRDTKTAEVFTWGTVVGTLAGPVLHGVAAITGSAQNTVMNTVYAIAYSNADNWGGAIAAFVTAVVINRKKLGARWFFRHPFHMANLATLVLLGGAYLLVHVGLGWQASTTLGAAVENVLLNNDSILASLFLLICMYEWFRLM